MFVHQIQILTVELLAGFVRVVYRNIRGFISDKVDLRASPHCSILGFL